jgi:hypothetical protein
MIVTRELRAKIRNQREQTVEFGGKQVPGSIPYIRDLMAIAEDDQDRDQLLVELAGEYLRADLDDEHLLVQRERVANHPDVAVTWLALAHSLSMRSDGGDEAKLAAAKAVAISRECGAMIRYSLRCQADLARKTNDRALFELALKGLIADAPSIREEDIELDDRVVADLPDGFCDSDLEAMYRRVLQT